MTSGLIFLYAAGCLGTVLAGLAGGWAALRRGARLPGWLPCLVLALSPYLLILQLLKLYASKDYADFTVWMEIVHNIARGRGAWSSVQDNFVPGTGRWLSSHFTPLIYGFAAPFRLWPRAETLLTAQFVLMMAAPLALYAFARAHLGSRRAAVAAAALLVLHPTFQYTNLYEFEMLRFVLAPIFALYWALESGRTRLYWVFLGLALLVREEVALTGVMIGLSIAAFTSRRRLGLATAAVSAAYFLVVNGLVMPALRTNRNVEHIAAGFFSALGHTPSEVAKNVFLKPWVVARLVADPVKLAGLFLFGLPLLFLPLAAWGTLLAAGANVGVNLLSFANVHTSYFLYYLSPALAILFVSLVQAIPKVAAVFERRLGAKHGLEVVLLGVFSAALAANVFFGPSPLSLSFWCRSWRLAPFRTLDFHYSHYRVTPHDRLADRVLSAVPPEASVSAEQFLFPRLYDRRSLKIFPDIAGVDYVAIDKKNPIKTGTGTVPGSWDGLRQDPQRYYDLVERDPAHWRLVASEDGYHVFRRVGAPQAREN